MGTVCCRTHTCKHLCLAPQHSLEEAETVTDSGNNKPVSLSIPSLIDDQHVHHVEVVVQHHPGGPHGPGPD